MIKVQIIDNTAQITPALFHADLSISSYSDEVKALNAIEKQQPSVVLLNYTVRKEETVEYIKLILGVCSDKKIIVIADELSEEKIINCLLAGAKGYQEIKRLDVYADKLVKVVDAGEAWITRRMVSTLLDRFTEN